MMALLLQIAILSSCGDNNTVEPQSEAINIEETISSDEEQNQGIVLIESTSGDEDEEEGDTLNIETAHDYSDFERLMWIIGEGLREENK